MKLTIVALVLMSTLVSAQPRWGGKGAGDRPANHRAVVEKLKLSDDQEKQFDKLQAELQKSQIAIRAKIQSARVDLRQLYNADKPERGQIEAKINDISKMQNELKLNRNGLWFDVNKILNADQQKVWKDHLRTMFQRMGDRMGQMMRGRMMRGDMMRNGMRGSMSGDDEPSGE